MRVLGGEFVRVLGGWLLEISFCPLYERRDDLLQKNSQKFFRGEKFFMADYFSSLTGVLALKTKSFPSKSSSTVSPSLTSPEIIFLLSSVSTV